MRRWWLPLGTVLLVLAALPATADAQRSGRRCNQVLKADARQLVNARGQEVVYFRDPVRMVCSAGLVIEADSAVFNRGEGTMQLVGNVVYRDSTRQLTAEWANYLGATDVLFARGDVVLQDLADGSRVTGDELEFQRQTAERPRSLMIVRGRRPHATIPPAARDGDPGGAPGDSTGPVRVWADRLQFEGETVFLAQGNAEIQRGELTGAADTARFDQVAERMTLVGRGHVENPQYRLEGDRIDALIPGDTLREVRVVGDSRLITEELRVSSHRILIALAAGQLERLQAWNPESLETHRPPPAPPEPAEGAGEPGDSAAGVAEAPRRERPEPGRPGRERRAPEGLQAQEGARAGAASAGDRAAGPGGAADSLPPLPRAVAVARDFTLRADSIDARADSGSIREVRAVSRAFGEREPDSLAAPVPELVARDWIQGDTIVGFFAVAPVEGPGDAQAERPTERPADVAGERPARAPAEEPAASDSVETVLERIVVVGGSGPALSLYRMAPGADGREGSLNFMKARRIVLHLTRGELDSVEADGPIEGMYLDPAAARGGGETEPPREETGA